MSEADDRRLPMLVAGGGLVGALAALFLARRGFAVEVRERRGDLRRGRGGEGRSINLAISTRGLHALALVGLEEAALRQAVPMRGRMIHAPDGALAFQPYGRRASEVINSISRAGLNRLLLDAAEATGRVALHFDRPVVGGAVAEGRLRVRLGAGEGEARGQALLGTDGAASVVRAAMAEAEPALVVTQSVLDYGYKELALPAGPGGTFRLEREALHIWPRGRYMLIALPNPDGSFTCTLFLPFAGGAESFASLDTAAQVEAFFAARFPDAAPLIPELGRHFTNNPTGQMVTVRCSAWNAGRCLLLGDAAHAIVPFYGQGMNCGFEDCVVLDELLAAAGPTPDWPALFASLGARRRPDCDAIAEMAVENFVEMRDRVADRRFQLRKQVEKRLEAAFPDQYLSGYTLVTFTRTPYRLARQAGLINDELLTELCRGIDDPAAVDLDRAASLIRTRLLPLWADWGREPGGAGG